MQRHIFTQKILAWILLLFAWQCYAADTTFEDMAQDELVKTVMNDQYGDTYDEEFQCWLYQDKEKHKYCIRPAKSELVEVDQGRRLYIITSNYFPPYGTPLGAKIDRPVPGLVGAFVLKKLKSENQWSYKNRSKELDYFKKDCCLIGEDTELKKLIDLMSMYGCLQRIV